MVVSLGCFSSGMSYAHTKSCTGCHSDIGKGHKHIHPAMNLGCESCHVPSNGKQHPTEKESIRLTNDLPKLCFQCHKESKFTGKDVHSPVAQGMCDTCHDPHQSDHPILLKDEQKECCYRCHAREQYTKQFVHMVAQGGCGTRCHNPHASEYPHLLSSEISDMCLGCHREQQSGTHIVALPGGKIHPVFWEKDPKNRRKEMTCASCHNPHCSEYRKLFTYKRICRRCHKAY
jgi:predicted CXXCH cytochrome family protein